MKYALFFAATAAASYDAYGGYGGAESSSAPAKVSSSAIASSAPAYGGYGSQPAPSSKAPTAASSAASSKTTPCSTSVGQNGYTTVVPGYGKPPVTVTSQYQAIPTCVAQGYDSKSCAKWGEDKYVSTTLTDADKKVVTVTNVKDCVTVYHEKKTITHSATPTLGGYAAPSSYPIGAKNSTGTWYELYEKIHVVEYENIGKNALPGYGGSGLCHECDNAQPYTIKECKSGKCSEEKKTFNYGKPKDEVKVYEKPGVYTVPAKVVTVYPSAPTGPAGNGNGHPKAPEAGVYTYEAKTITITKPNQQYTCTYELPKQTPSKGEEYPASATKTPSHGEEYPVTKTEIHNNGYQASSTPKAPGNEYPSYPNVPVKSNSTSSAHGNGYGNAPSSTPCTESETHATPTPASSKPAEYGNTASSAPAYGNAASSSAPAYGDNGYGAHSTLVVASSSKPVEYGQPASSSPAAYNNGYGGEKPSATVPAQASSTPCESELKHTSTPAATATPYVPVYGGNKPSSSAPVYNGEKSSSAPVYGGNKPSSSAPAYAGSSSAPAQASSTPCESELKHSSTPAATPTPYVPVYGGNKPSSSAPVYNGQKSSSAPAYAGSSSAPAKASSTPCESESKHASTPAATPTPYAPVYGNNVASSSASKPSTTPAPYAPVYGGNKPSSSAPAQASSTPCESSDLKTSTATPAPTATPYVPVYGGNNKPSSTVPAAASSTPCDDETKTTPAATPYASAPAYANANPSPTPAAPVYNNNNNGGYGGDNKPSPSPAAPAHTSAAAAGGYGYTKRDNMMERRKRAAAL